MSKSQTVGLFSLVIAVIALLFGDNLLERYYNSEPEGAKTDYYVNVDSISYHRFIEKADNLIRKTPPEYAQALILYQTAYEIGESNGNIDLKVANDGIVRCQSEIESRLAENTAQKLNDKNDIQLKFYRLSLTGFTVNHEIIVNDELHGTLGVLGTKTISVKDADVDILLRANMFESFNNMRIKLTEVSPGNIYHIHVYHGLLGFNYHLVTIDQ